MPHIPHVEFVNGPEFPPWRKSGLDLVEVGCRGHSQQAQNLSLQLGELGREDSAALAPASHGVRRAIHSWGARQRRAVGAESRDTGVPRPKTA